MPTSDPNNLNGIGAILTSIGVFIMAIFGRNSLDKDIRDLKNNVMYRDTFDEFKTAQTTEHTDLKDKLKSIDGKLDTLLRGRNYEN